MHGETETEYKKIGYLCFAGTGKVIARGSGKKRDERF